jgi:hypothetical protein
MAMKRHILIDAEIFENYPLGDPFFAGDGVMPATAPDRDG